MVLMENRFGVVMVVRQKGVGKTTGDQHNRDLGGDRTSSVS